LITAAALCLEPFARRVSRLGTTIQYRDVWVAEVALGLAFAAAILAHRYSRSRPRASA
jgi:hypothetical protein